MSDAIKTLVAELERMERVASPAPWEASSTICCPDRGTVSVQEHNHTQPTHAFATWDADLVAASRNALPVLLAELHRLWAVEQAAVRYRDIVKRPVSYVGLLATMESADAAESALFALLRAEVKL